MLLLSFSLNFFTSIVICSGALQTFNFQANTPCDENIELTLDGEIETKPESAVACAMLCTETAGCGGFLYYSGTKACYGINADSPMFEACAGPGAKFYKDPGLLTTTPPPTPTTPPSSCDTGLVSGLPDSSLTASSSLDSNICGPEKAKMSKEDAWIAAVSDQNQYIQVDFGQLNTVVSIATRGDSQTGAYVKNYNVLISNNCSAFEELVNPDGIARVYSGNDNAEDLVTNAVVPVVHARCVRIKPTDWYGFIIMKLEILGC